MIKFGLIIYNFNFPLFRIALKGKFKTHTHTHTHKELRERNTIKERKKLHLSYFWNKGFHSFIFMDTPQLCSQPCYISSAP